MVLLQEDLSDPLHHLGGDVTWRRGEQLRLVIRGFDLRPEQAGWLSGITKSIVAATAPIEFSLKSTEFLPSSERAQFVAVQVDHGADAIRQLRAALEPELAAAGVSPEETEWTPMVQLGRLRTLQYRPTLSGVVRPYSETDFGVTTADSAVLVTTELVGGRARERQSKRFTFGADAP
ncbi:MAG: 2'-5' RNA ligase [Bradymonadia bacterium]